MTGLLRYASQSHAPLSNNPKHQNAARHALVHYPTGAIYSFIPKNACSTLRLSLAVANGCIADEKDYAWIHRNNDTFAANLSEMVRAPLSFVVLRCPHARLASVFLDKIVGRERDMWDLLRHSGEAFDPDIITFRAFVDLLKNPALLALNIHWRPQIGFLAFQDYTHWFALERFDAVGPILKNTLGLDIFDARALTQHGSDYQKTLQEGHFFDTPAWQVAEMKREHKTPHLRCFYDDALASDVAALYAQDMQLYAQHCDAHDLLYPALREEPNQ